MPSPFTAPVTAMEDIQSKSLRLPTGPIIVATDGTPDSDSAIVAAQLFASHTGAPIQLVSAVEPVIIQTFDMGTVPADPAFYGPRRAMQRELVHDQLRRLLPPGTELQVTLLDGIAAQMLAREAHDRHARLLILGRGRHGLVDRLGRSHMREHCRHRRSQRHIPLDHNRTHGARDIRTAHASCDCLRGRRLR